MKDKNDLEPSDYTTGVSNILNQLSPLEILLEKYDFKDIEELDRYLFSHIPMVYDGKKWRKCENE